MLVHHFGTKSHIFCFSSTLLTGNCTKINKKSHERRYSASKIYCHFKKYLMYYSEDLATKKKTLINKKNGLLVFNAAPKYWSYCTKEYTFNEMDKNIKFT